MKVQIILCSAVLCKAKMQKGKPSFIGSYPNGEFVPAPFITACLSWFLFVTISFWRQKHDLHCWQNCSAANLQFILAAWCVCSYPGCWWLDRDYCFMPCRCIVWDMFIYKLEQAVTTDMWPRRPSINVWFKNQVEGAASRNNNKTMSTGKSAGWFYQNVPGFWAMLIY